METVIETVLSYLIDLIGSQVLGLFNPLVLILLVVCLILSYKLYDMYRLWDKIEVDKKIYFDLMADLAYFSRKDPRNRHVIVNQLIWDFTCHYNETSDTFLDIDENWTVNFTTEFPYTIKEFELGIRGGDPSDLKIADFSTYQDSHKLYAPNPGVVGTGYKFALNSYVRHKENSEIHVAFKWPEFILVDHKDDYFFFVPKTIAKQVKQFKIRITHPYNCNFRIYIFRDEGLLLKKNLIDASNASQFKAIYNQSDSRKFEFEIQDMNPMDALLIIFDKNDN